MLVLFMRAEEDAACQAFHETWKEVQTLKDQYQQTERRDYYLSQKDDRVVWPNLYMSSDFLDKKKVKAVCLCLSTPRRSSEHQLIPIFFWPEGNRHSKVLASLAGNSRESRKTQCSFVTRRMGGKCKVSPNDLSCEDPLEGSTEGKT